MQKRSSRPKRNFLILRGKIEGVPSHKIQLGMLSILQHQVECIIRSFPDSNIYVMANPNILYPMSLRATYIYNDLWHYYGEAGDIYYFFEKMSSHQNTKPWEIDGLTILLGNTVFPVSDAAYIRESRRSYILQSRPNEITHVDSISLSTREYNSGQGTTSDVSSGRSPCVKKLDFSSQKLWGGIIHLSNNHLIKVHQNVQNRPKRYLFEVMNELLITSRIRVLPTDMNSIDIRGKKELAYARRHFGINT